MGKSVNRITILGNLGRDPEIKTTQSGKSVCTLNIATSEIHRDKSSEWTESTDWHNVVLWEPLAGIAEKYLKKGNKVYIEGRLKTRSYDNDGVKQYTTEIIANNLVLINSTK